MRPMRPALGLIGLFSSVARPRCVSRCARLHWTGALDLRPQEAAEVPRVLIFHPLGGEGSGYSLREGPLMREFVGQMTVPDCPLPEIRITLAAFQTRRVLPRDDFQT